MRHTWLLTCKLVTTYSVPQLCSPHVKSTESPLQDTELRGSVVVQGHEAGKGRSGVCEASGTELAADSRTGGSLVPKAGEGATFLQKLF